MGRKRIRSKRLTRSKNNPKSRRSLRPRRTKKNDRTKKKRIKRRQQNRTSKRVRNTRGGSSEAEKRAKLNKLKVSQLKKLAKENGVTDDEMDDADDADNTKDFIINLIIEKEEGAGSQAEAEVLPTKLSGLKTAAQNLGMAQTMLDDIDDSSDNTEAKKRKLREWILSNQSVGEGESQTGMLQAIANCGLGTGRVCGLGNLFTTAPVEAPRPAPKLDAPAALTHDQVIELLKRPNIGKETKDDGEHWNFLGGQDWDKLRKDQIELVSALGWTPELWDAHQYPKSNNPNDRTRQYEDSLRDQFLEDAGRGYEWWNGSKTAAGPPELGEHAPQAVIVAHRKAWESGQPRRR